MIGVSDIDPDEAVRLASGQARVLGLDVQGGAVLRRGFNVLVHLVPHPIVARLTPDTAPDGPRDAHSHMQNEVMVTRLLGKSAAAAAPTTIVDAGPHRLEGVVVSYWDYHERDEPTDPFRAGAALASCHSMLQGADLELHGDPNPPGEAQAIFDDLVGRAGFDSARARRIARTNAEDLDEMRALDLPLQIVHGDAHLENLLVREGRHLWNDWEDTFRGPVEWDLACLVATAKSTGAGRERTELALRGYGIDHLPDSVDLVVRVRAFQIATWLLAAARRFGARADQADPWLAHVERRSQRLRRARRILRPRR